MSDRGWFDKADYKSFALFRTLPRRVQHVLIEPICFGVLVGDAAESAWRGIKDSCTIYREIRTEAHERINKSDYEVPEETTCRHDDPDNTGQCIKCRKVLYD